MEAEVIDTLGRVFTEEGPHGLAEGLDGDAKDGGYLSLIQYGTVAFPGQVLALRDGRFVATQTKYDFVLIGEGY